jgi:hypothetical protein
MKNTRELEEKSRFRWRNGVHLAFLLTMACLCVIVPVTNSLTGTPPYWAIAILFSIPLLLYSIFLVRNPLALITTTTIAAYITILYNNRYVITRKTVQKNHLVQ